MYWVVFMLPSSDAADKCAPCTLREPLMDVTFLKLCAQHAIRPRRGLQADRCRNVRWGFFFWSPDRPFILLLSYTPSSSFITTPHQLVSTRADTLSNQREPKLTSMQHFSQLPLDACRGVLCSAPAHSLEPHRPQPGLVWWPHHGELRGNAHTHTCNAICCCITKPLIQERQCDHI